MTNKQRYREAIYDQFYELYPELGLTQIKISGELGILQQNINQWRYHGIPVKHCAHLSKMLHDIIPLPVFLPDIFDLDFSYSDDNRTTAINMIKERRKAYYARQPLEAIKVL